MTCSVPEPEPAPEAEPWTVAQAAASLTNLPARHMLMLLPGLDQSLLPETRRALVQRFSTEVRFSTTPVVVHTWQDAWNVATRAVTHRPGEVAFWAYVPCPECHGRRWSPRTMGVCLKCSGQGRKNTHVRQAAHYAVDPATQAVRDADYHRERPWERNERLKAEARAATEERA